MFAGILVREQLNNNSLAIFDYYMVLCRFSVYCHCRRYDWLKVYLNIFTQTHTSKSIRNQTENKQEQNSETTTDPIKFETEIKRKKINRCTEPFKEKYKMMRKNIK